MHDVHLFRLILKTPIVFYNKRIKSLYKKYLYKIKKEEGHRVMNNIILLSFFLILFLYKLKLRIKSQLVKIKI